MPKAFSSLEGRAGACTCSRSPGGRGALALARSPQQGEAAGPWKAPSAGCASPIRNSISRLPVAKGSAAPCAGSARGRGGLVPRGARDGSRFEFLPKDGQQFT